MQPDKNEHSENEQNEEQKEDQTSSIPNPFDPNDDRKISEEDLENEQKYKEALTERD